MEFYAIYEEEGLQPQDQGYLGIAPLKTRAFEREKKDSFVENLKKSGAIRRSVVGLFISPDESKNPHEIQIGEYNTTYVDGGEKNLVWMSLIKEDRWMAELTDSYYGDDVLFTHFFKPAEINAGFEGIGVQQSDYNQLRRKILELDDSWYCDETECISSEPCEEHYDKI